MSDPATDDVLSTGWANRIVDGTIHLVPPGDLIANPLNARRHPGAQRDALREALTRLGWIAPLAVNIRTGRMIDGHARTEEALATSGVDVVPVYYVDLDEDEERFALATLDPITLMATIDPAVLDQLIADIDFGDGALAQLIADLDAQWPVEVGEPGGPNLRADPDEIPEPPTAPVTTRGDIWLLGPHRLACGDCTTVADVDALFAGANIDLICTDPPYCSGGFQESGKSAGSVGTNAEHKHIASDRLSTRGYQALVGAALEHGRNAGADYLYVFTDWRMWTYLFDLVERTGAGVRSMIVWDKGTPGMGRGWRSQHELVMHGAAKTPPYPAKFPARGNVIQSKRTGNVLHTTQKPVDVIEQLLRNSPYATTVFDPFAGSGTTLMAAYLVGMVTYAMEKDAAYVDVICRRFQEATGIVPVLESTGKPHDFTTV